MRVSIRVLQRQSASSKQWLNRQSKDQFVRKRREESFISRSAFKLSELSLSQRFIHAKSTVLDLGAAPGGWTQVALRAGARKVVSVDLLPPSLPSNILGVDWIIGDFTTPEVIRQIKEKQERYSVVLCDAAPSYSGQKSLDHMRLITLAEVASDLASEMLALKGGTFMVKVSRGGEEIRFRDRLRKQYSKVEFIKPKASRQESTEIYLLCSR